METILGGGPRTLISTEDPEYSSVHLFGYTLLFL